MSTGIIRRRSLRPQPQKLAYKKPTVELNRFKRFKLKSDAEQADILIELLDSGNWFEYWQYRGH